MLNCLYQNAHIDRQEFYPVKSDVNYKSYKVNIKIHTYKIDNI